MKRIPVILLLLVSISTIYSQDTITIDDIKPKNTFYFAPFNAIAREFKIGYEHVFRKNNSILLRTGGVIDESEFTGAKYGLNSSVHFRKYIVYNMITSKKTKRNVVKERQRHNLWGFYLDVFGGYQFIQSENGGYYYDPYYYPPNVRLRYHAGIVGLTPGFRFDFAKGRVTLDMYGGVGVKVSGSNNPFNSNNPNVTYYDDYGGIHQIGTTGIVPRGNIELGINF